MAAVAVGWLIGNPIETIILRALVTMAILWPVGYAVGLIAQGVVDRNIEKYKAEHPILSEEELQKLTGETNEKPAESPDDPTAAIKPSTLSAQARTTGAA